MPDPPLSHNDVEYPAPPISREEVMAYCAAEHTYRLARADFERKHGLIAYKLMLGCDVDESASVSVRLDREGRVVCSDACSSGPPIVTRS